MNNHIQRSCYRAQHGFVLITSLLLLVVVTIMALSMFRSFGVQGMIAGNLREHQRALNAAESAQSYAEWWLTFGSNAASTTVNCNSLQNANGNFGQICSNTLATVVGGSGNIGNVPWLVGGAEVGVTYTPLGSDSALAMSFNAPSTSAASTSPESEPYFEAPRFYISDLGASKDPSIPGEIYQIDAVGYGAYSNTAAVVESTFAVYVDSRNTNI